jgi:pimeloyl-ACP methyl ester carboxylesterase
VLIAAIVTTTILVGLLGADALTSMAYKPRTQILALGQESKRAIVFFTGVQSSAEAHSAQVRQLWQRYGQVVIVEYPRDTFYADETVQKTFDYLVDHQYDEVVLIGASMGGLLALDLINLNRKRSHPFKVVGVIACDAPLTPDDLRQKSMANMTKFWHAGWISNSLTSLFWKFGFKPNRQVEPDVDMAILNRHQDISGSWQLSSYAAQVRYLVSYPPVESGQYTEIPLAILRATQDQDILDSHIARWLVAFDVPVSWIEKLVYRVESTHVGFNEFPEAWRQGFTHAFDQLGVQPIG